MTFHTNDVAALLNLGDTERRLLAATVTYTELAEIVLDPTVLRATDFTTSEEHPRIYTAYRAVKDRGDVLTLAALILELEQRGWRETRDYLLTSVINALPWTPSQEDVAVWIKALQVSREDRARQATQIEAVTALTNGDLNGAHTILKKHIAKPRQTKQQASEPEPEADAQPSIDTTRLTQSERIKAWLKAQGWAFRLNMAGSILECNGQPLEDFLAADIRMCYRDTEQRNIGMLEDVWRSEARRNAFHPIQDYLNSVEWDGENHISKLATYLTCSDPEIIYPNGERRSTAGTYLYRWLIGAVAKVFDRKQNAMLVLGGPQGIGKSEFVRWLCSKLPEHYFEGQIQPGDRDSMLRFATNFIWEVAELDATTRRADRSALKGALTQESIKLRKAYGHFDTNAPAIVSFIGTFNPDHAGFLDDPSGSRRFWITTLTKINWAYQRDIDVDQVWAEAVAAYRRGTPWRLRPEEEQQRIALNEQHEVEDPMLAFLERFFVLDAGPTYRMNSAEIILHLSDREAPLSYHNPRALSMDIARALKKRGIEKVGAGSTRMYVGVAPRITDQA